MSDAVLLTLLWFLPLAGALVVLLIPRQAEGAVKWTSLGFTAATFLLTLLAYGQYVVEGSQAARPLAERAENNALTSEQPRGLPTVAQESGPGEHDLMVRRAWIPYFNIQYFLGLDGISLSLVLLTGLVSLLACLASWNIDHQVKGYFALFLV